ncbi:glycosyl hydrolase family 76-domain-containing protein [Lipomyces japonicus]|uniref:glycosyl hydrolase family 76-domain-containing protein n=1 Tax=Lipomyces japonicus TaxID=56871 RepID=UPI0034CEDCD0
MLAIIWTALAVMSLLSTAHANGFTLDLTSESSIKSAAKIVAQGLMNYYHGDESGYTPGIFSGDYYWWESGAAWGSLMDYQYLTGDTQYNDVMKTGLLFQVGTDWDYTPKNQTLSLGNDDQGFWGITAMMAAERNFTNPDSDQPQWLGLAQAVFNSIALTWDTQYCDGGVRWQKFVLNKGYDYKNSIANGILFQLGARLARYTNNDTYAEWAEKVWDWETNIGLIPSATYFVYDGGSVDDNCARLNKIQWTYNMAVFLAGSAYMYNYTASSNLTSSGGTASTWEQRTTSLVSTLTAFIYQSSNIVYEPACEPSKSCNPDQQSFKAYLARWLGATMILAPFTTDIILPVLKASALAAASTCNGGTDGVTCGFSWTTEGTYDGMYGLGEQMAALEIIQSHLLQYNPAPYTNTTGGSSTGDSSLGTDELSGTSSKSITSKDRAGAWIITIAACVFVVLGAVWMGVEDKFEGTKNLKEWIRLEDLS